MDKYLPEIFGKVCLNPAYNSTQGIVFNLPWQGQFRELYDIPVRAREIVVDGPTIGQFIIGRAIYYENSVRVQMFRPTKKGMPRFRIRDSMRNYEVFLVPEPFTDEQIIDVAIKAAFVHEVHQ